MWGENLVLKRGRYVTLSFSLIAFLVLGLLIVSKGVNSQAEEKSKLYDLSDFPAQFLLDKIPEELRKINEPIYRIQNGTIVVGNVPSPDYSSAGSLTSIGCPPVMEAVGKCRNGLVIVKENELDSLYKTNLISVGGPCANPATAAIMNIPTSWPECTSGFREGTAILRLYNISGKFQLIVAGYSALDTRRATFILYEFEKYNLSGKCIEITS